MPKSPVKLRKKAPAPPPPKKLQNHFCFVIDRSGSMNALRHDVVAVFNKQAAQIRELTVKAGHESRVSLYTFSDLVDDPVFFNENIEELGELDLADYQPDGWTALRDAVG